MTIKREHPSKKHFHKGELIFEEGQEGSMAFIVEVGSITLTKMVEGEKITLATLHQGELFGEMAIIDGSTRMATAHAAENTVLITINKHLLTSQLEKHGKFVQGLVRVLIENLRTVHKTYMRRARSVDDYLDAVNFHLENLNAYLQKPDCEDVTSEAAKHLDDINRKLGSLRTVFADHMDNRKNVIENKDVTSPEKKEP